jgi:dipeptidase E
VKLLLTSAGIKNPTINDAMLDLLGKPIAECDALCIPTASYGHAPGGFHGTYRFITGQTTTPMCELGWKSIGVLELAALPTLDKELWVPLVEQTDVLLANGGDSLYLAHHMVASGLADLLPSLSAVWPQTEGWLVSEPDNRTARLHARFRTERRTGRSVEHQPDARGGVQRRPEPGA